MGNQLPVRRQAEVVVKKIEENALAKLPKGKHPSADTLERCHNQGLIGQRLNLAVDIVNRYHSGLSYIAQWLEDGISFDVIPWLLEYKKVHCFGDSIVLLAKYFDMLGFHIPNQGEEDVQLLQNSSTIPLDEIIGTFQEVAEVMGTFQAHYDILGVIEDFYEGDIHQAYLDAVDDLRGFVCRVYPYREKPLRVPGDIRAYLEHQLGSDYHAADGPTWEDLETEI